MELPLSLVGIFGSGWIEDKIWEVIGSADKVGFYLSAGRRKANDFRSPRESRTAETWQAERWLALHQCGGFDCKIAQYSVGSGAFDAS